MKRMWDTDEVIAVCQEVHNKLGIDAIVVEELPSPENARKGVIYLVPSEDGEEGNIYEEYIFTSSGFELLGTTKIDLSNYPRKNQNETITSTWTWNANAGIKFANSYGVGYTIRNKGDGFLQIFNNNNSPVYDFDNLGFISRENKDLGSNSYKWKDLYLSGNISDGTNSVSVADLANLISYAKTQGWIS